MSDTPRTDAAIHLPIIHVSGADDVVAVAFARQLERELIKAQKNVEAQSKIIGLLRHQLNTLLSERPFEVATISDSETGLVREVRVHAVRQ